MKKILIGMALVCGIIGPAHALFESTERVDIRFATASVVSTQNWILVDLSSGGATAPYPHSKNGSINLHGIELGVSKVAASSGAVKVGVVEYLDTSSGTVRWIWGYDWSKSAALTELSKSSFYDQNRVNGVVVSTTTRYTRSNDVSTLSTTFQSDVSLPTSMGNSTQPGVGDLILNYTTAGTSPTNLDIKVFYGSEAP